MQNKTIFQKDETLTDDEREEQQKFYEERRRLRKEEEDAEKRNFSWFVRYLVWIYIIRS